jgi:hypothetical protein
MTPLFYPAASIMLVGCEPDLAAACLSAFPELLVLSVAHAPAAVERMLVTRPLVVVVSDDLTRSKEDRLVIECARDIRAEVVRLAIVARADLHPSIRASILIAERNREETARRPG